MKAEQYFYVGWKHNMFICPPNKEVFFMCLVVVFSWLPYYGLGLSGYKEKLRM
jgi:hypothetical protein